MPLFFREKKETSLKADCTASEIGDSPIVVPSADLERRPESNPDSNQGDQMTMSGDHSNVSAEVVPSRKKKPINWVLIASVVWLLIPVVALLYLMSTDGFTRNFVLGRLHWVCRDNTAAVGYFSNALQAKQDVNALEARADCYSNIGDLEKERNDLRALVKLIDLQKDRSWKSYRNYPRLAALDVRLGDIDSATRIYRLYSTFSYKVGKPDTYYKKDAAYKLLLLGNLSDSKELLAKIELIDPEKGTDPISNVLVGRSDGFPQLLHALIYREEGNKVKALDTTRSVGDKYVWEFRDSRWRSGSKYEVVPWTLEALIHLDDRDTDKARPLIKMAESELSDLDKPASEPILGVVKAWLLLEEGRLDDCLKLTATTLESDDEADQSIVRQNLNAALHLIRKNVFQKQNLSEQAAREDELYKQTRVSGLVFTPICYRTKQ